MTFSDKRIVRLVEEKLVPVWESVAPVKVAVFDLGDGEEVRGTVGGEIALYFCRPDGVVFDVLPALQSPKVTLDAIREALDFYERTGATAAAIRERYLGDTLVAHGDVSVSDALARAANADAATKDLHEMAFSKTLVISDAEPTVVVEPGGLERYRRKIRAMLATSNEATPEQWKSFVFTTVMNQKLEGGVFKYDSESLEPMSIVED